MEVHLPGLSSVDLAFGLSNDLIDAAGVPLHLFRSIEGHDELFYVLERPVHVMVLMVVVVVMMVMVFTLLQTFDCDSHVRGFDPMAFSRFKDEFCLRYSKAIKLIDHGFPIPEVFQKGCSYHISGGSHGAVDVQGLHYSVSFLFIWLITDAL